MVSAKRRTDGRRSPGTERASGDLGADRAHHVNGPGAAVDPSFALRCPTCTGSPRPYSFAETVAGLFLVSPPPGPLLWRLEKSEDRWQRTSRGWGNGLLGVIIFSGSLPATRVAVGGFSAAVPDVRARDHRGADRCRPCSACCARRGPSAGDIALARHRLHRRRRRLPAADGAGAAAHHLGAFDRLHRPAAAGDRDLRRAARRRAAAGPPSGCSRFSAASRSRALRSRATAAARSPAIC